MLLLALKEEGGDWGQGKQAASEEGKGKSTLSLEPPFPRLRPAQGGPLWLPDLKSFERASR